MNRQIVYEAKAVDGLRSMPEEDRTRILKALRRYADEAVGDVKKLHGSLEGYWRLRKGDWRAIFRLESGPLLRVVAIDNRRDAY